MPEARSKRSRYLRPEALTRISHLELRARQIVEGFVSGMHASPFKGFSVEFADHRPYVPGDDVRHIDWRLYAKADRFYVKEYEVETNARTYLVLDCSSSMAYSSQDMGRGSPAASGRGGSPPSWSAGDRMTKWEYAATVAVCLAYLLVIRQSDAAGLVLFDERIIEPPAGAPVSTSQAALSAMVETLERHAPDGKTDLKLPLEELADRIPRRGLAVILSDLLADAESVVAGLQRFRSAGHEVLVLHILDHDEIEFPFTDRTLFEGIEEAGLQVRTDPQALRASYQEALQRFLGRIRGACLDRQIDYTLLSTADPVETALTAFLASRMHRLREKVSG